MNALKSWAAAGAILFATGCASLSPSDLVEPSEVTLEQALTSVGNGLYKMKKAQGKMKTGLIAESVEVTFNLAASAKDTGKLTIDLSRKITTDSVDRGRTIGAEQTSSSDASRSNAITVRFVNILTIPKETLAYTKSPEEIAKMILLPAAGGWNVFSTDICARQLLGALINMPIELRQDEVSCVQ